MEPMDDCSLPSSTFEIITLKLFFGTLCQAGDDLSLDTVF